MCIHFQEHVNVTIFIFQVMTRYISNPDNLKLMMNMLKEKSRNIQFEAFHVFKVYLRYSVIVIVN